MSRGVVRESGHICIPLFTQKGNIRSVQQILLGLTQEHQRFEMYWMGPATVDQPRAQSQEDASPV